MDILTAIQNARATDDSQQDSEDSLEVELLMEPVEPEDNEDKPRFQKENVFNKFLPYAEELEIEADIMFAELKANLGRSILLRKIHFETLGSATRLKSYIRLYGLRFSKEDHIQFVKLFYELVTIPELDPSMLGLFTIVLAKLLSKKELISPDELELPWKPLYDVLAPIAIRGQTSLNFKHQEVIGSLLEPVIRVAKNYFPLSATQEILDELKPKLCPFDTVTLYSAVKCLEWFLPVQLRPQHHAQGHHLWMSELMSFWEVCHNSPTIENDLMWLMAKLAYYNIGYIDWEPYLPIMFTRFLRSLNLPVNYKGTKIQATHKFATYPIAVWIVSALGNKSSAQMYLDKFLKSIETYFNPANCGPWLRRLKELYYTISYYFLKRFHRERFMKLKWETPIPDSHKLTDEDIDAFVKSMSVIAVAVVFNKTFTRDFCNALRYLAIIRPSIIIPLVLDKVYPALGGTIETHKHVAAMNCMVSIASPLVQGNRNSMTGYTFAEGPLHVLPLLFSALPGIDPNDPNRCFATFHFIITMVTLIPIVDCSQSPVEMSEEERMVAEETSRFEDFVLQFMDKVFLLIDSSSLEFVRLENRESDGDKSTIDAVAEATLCTAFNFLLKQTSDVIFKSALSKLRTFITEHILETKVAGQMATVLCRAFSQANGPETLRTLLPFLSQTILDTIGEGDEVIKDENLDGRLLYAMLLTLGVVETNGCDLLPYMDTLTKVLDKVLFLKSREGNQLGTRLLLNILKSLCSVSAKGLDRDLNDPQRLYIREWGESRKITASTILWYVPGDEEISAAQQIFNRFFIPAVAAIEKYTADPSTLSREELRMNLSIISQTLCGCESVLPTWTEPGLSIEDIDFCPNILRPVVGRKGEIQMPDKSNVKWSLVKIMAALQETMLNNSEDDTLSFAVIIQIWHYLGLGRFRLLEMINVTRKYFLTVMKGRDDKLVGSKGYLPLYAFKRVSIQHEERLQCGINNFTETHRQITLNLLKLATSRYSQVRSKSQNSLMIVLDRFFVSYKFMLPFIVEVLQLDTVENHDAYKGILYVIMGRTNHTIIIERDWNYLKTLWPAIVLSKPSEKNSVIRLKNYITAIDGNCFETISFDLDIPEEVFKQTRMLWQTGVPPSAPIPSEKEIEEGIQALKTFEKNSMDSYNELLDSLLNAIQEKNLHWRHRMIAVNFLRTLLHADLKFPPKIFRFFLDSLIHDSLDERKTAISTVAYIFKQLKRKHPKIVLDKSSMRTTWTGVQSTGPGVRSDNIWLQYNSKTVPTSQEQWDEPRYVHKMYVGYYEMPKNVEIYAPSKDQPCLDAKVRVLTEHEMEVDRFFNNPQNVEKLVKYLSLEEKNGKDRFNTMRSLVFKGLFRNHGDAYLHHFLPHLQRLVADKQESNQRCAAEILSGLIRGSKHWPYEMVEKMYESILPLVRTVLSNMTVETVTDWVQCFITALRGRDPNRHHWLLECLMEEPPLGDSESSFVECGRLHVLQGALLAQSWKATELFHRQLARIEDRLQSNPIQNVRNHLAAVLVSTFHGDLTYPGHVDASDRHIPRVQDFLDRICPKLEPLMAYDEENQMEVDGSQNAEKREAAIRLFKTVCKWINGSLTRNSYGAVAGFYKIYPYICHLENSDKDDELPKLCTGTLAVLSRAFTLPKSMQAAIDTIVEESKNPSWLIRKNSVEFLQVLVLHNMSTLLSNEKWVESIQEIVLRLLEDKHVEVREKAGTVLCGLLHCTFIPDHEELLETFKKLAKTKLRKRTKQEAQLKKSTEVADAIRLRHAGVLGMCAFIRAHPYDVPKHVPPIFECIGAHLNDPQPIPATIRHTLNDFKRTHCDGWTGFEGLAESFTEAQYEVLQNLTVPPSYYA